MTNWIRLSEASYHFEIPLGSLCNLLGLSNVPENQLDKYWLLVENSRRRMAGKKQQQVPAGKMDNVSTRILYVIRSEDIYSEDDPNPLLFIFSSLQHMTPLFQQIIVECYLNLSKERSREIFRRLSLGENVYTLAEELDLTRGEIYKRYEAAIKELMAKQEEVINNLKVKYALAERVNELEKINQRLVCKEEMSNMSSGQYMLETSPTVKELITKNLRKLSLTFTDIGLNYPIRRLLATNGIETVPELLRFLKLFGPNYFLTFKNFGRRSMSTLKKRLLDAGLIDENFNSEFFDYID